MNPTREELLFTRAHAASVNSRFWVIEVSQIQRILPWLNGHHLFSG